MTTVLSMFRRSLIYHYSSIRFFSLRAPNLSIKSKLQTGRNVEMESVEHSITERTVFFDLECGDDNSVFALGALLGTHPPLVARNAEQVRHQMPVFRDWVRSARFLCGHNSIAHDLPQLRQLHGPEEYAGKVIDTLYLSPIAYPTKPYHHLTKEDKLVRESRNDGSG